MSINIENNYNLEELIREKEETRVKMNNSRENFFKLSKSSPKYEIALKEFSNLFEKYKELKDEVTSLQEAIMTDGIIDLKKDNLQLEGTYNIYLHETNEKIGTIDYRGYHISEAIGDIGYGIDEKFRGNGYALKALNLLSEYLYNNGILSFWVVIRNNNMPSLKKVANYGGKELKENEAAETILFECQAMIRNKGENTIRDIA